MTKRGLIIQGNQGAEAMPTSATIFPIVSGETYIMFNLEYRLHATMNEDDQFISGQKGMGIGGVPLQQWVFTKVRGNWTIKNVESGLYLAWADNDQLGVIKALDRPQYWDIRQIPGTSTFQLYSVGWDGCVLQLQGGMPRKRLNIYREDKAYGTTWQIIKSTRRH